MRPRSFALLSVAVLVGCGSRTGLLVPGEVELEGPDGAASPVGDDSGEAAFDATTDATEVRDALPSIDVTAPVKPVNDCPDAGATLVYVVTRQEQLLSFYPPTAQFRAIGPLSCPTRSATNPFSMAVDRTGIAYVLYQDGELFRVSTATARCQATSFRAGQSGFAGTFGMGFSHDNTGTGETLFVASGDSATTPSLGTIDPRTFSLRIVGDLQPAILNAELSGTGAGDLFAFFATTGAAPCDNMPNGDCADSAIGQLDKTTGRVVAQSVLRGNPQGTAWAFAFWGGDFYTFTAPGNGGTIVNRFNPADRSIVTVATRPDQIVGAGVSTCAPAQ
jgi:hypothetical protein